MTKGEQILTDEITRFSKHVCALRTFLIGLADNMEALGPSGSEFTDSASADIRSLLAEQNPRPPNAD